MSERKFTDRHGPFAYFCVIAILAACFAPAAGIAIGAITAIYLGRAGERGYAKGEEAKARANGGAA